jgi:two-component system, response regulator PdtaR
MSKLRILIVEDEAVTAADLHDELHMQGYEVIGISDTAETALRLAEEGKPDIVLMDIKLADFIDGVLAASGMRGLGIPVIFLTAHYDTRTLERAKRAAPVGYITKPFRPHELTVAIEIGMERHRSDAERMRLLRELDHERAQVKMLSGLLPICACCKKIRDEGGDWQSIERYIAGHSEATFSHSYCPACEAKAMTDAEKTFGEAPVPTDR